MMPTTHVFRARFGRFLLVGMVFAQMLFGAFVWITNGIASVRDSVPLFTSWSLLAYLGGSIGITLLLVPIFLLLVYLLPVKVSADAFTCPNGFGNMISVPWNEITAVRYVPVPGFPYLLVSTSGRFFKLWLPLCLHRLPELVEKVEQFAGQGHILYQALWPRVEQK